MADCECDTRSATGGGAVRDLGEIVQELHRIFESDRVNIEDVKAVLESYKSSSKDWNKYSKFDIHRYTRNLVDKGNAKFNLMVLCWGEGHGSSIHDHSDSHCFVKILDGQLMETMFDWPQESEGESPMAQKHSMTYEKNGVTYINDSMGLHRMENPSHTKTAVTLHLYSPPFSDCKTFDEKTGHCRKTQVTFWSEYGKRIPYSPQTNGCAGVPKECCSDRDGAPQ